MSRADTQGSALVPILVGSCVLVAFFAVSLSFRVPIGSIDPGFSANWARGIAAAAAGLCFAVCGVRVPALRDPLFHARGFAVVTGAAGSIVLASILAWAAPAVLAAGGIGAAVGYGAASLSIRESRGSNFLFALILALLLIVVVVVSMASVATHHGVGAIGTWLLADVSAVSGSGALLALVMAVMLCGWMLNGGSTVAVPLLFGLGLGLAGPVLFVSWFAPLLATALMRGGEADELGAARLVASAAIGAALLVLADALPRVLVGGYAPPLTPAIAIVAVPCVIWANRDRLRQLAAGRGERESTLVSSLEALGVAAGVGLIAYVAYSVVVFVDLAT